jgi:hypothetical protein
MIKYSKFEVVILSIFFYEIDFRREQKLIKKPKKLLGLLALLQCYEHVYCIKFEVNNFYSFRENEY